MLLYLLIIAIICGWIVKKVSHEKIMLILFMWIPLQNFVLPFLYTSFQLSVDLVTSLIMFKEVLVLFLFIVLIVKKSIGFNDFPNSIKLSYFLLIFISLYTIISIFIYDPFSIDMRQLRNLIFPFEIIIIGYLISINMVTLNKLIKVGLLISVLVSLFGIIEVTLLDNSFYLNYVNIADYNYYVKGDARVIFSEGIGGSNQGRAGFERRLSSTYGDPLSFGIANSLFFLLALTYLSGHKRAKFIIPVVILLLALLLTFSRATWLLIAFAIMYYLFKRLDFMVIYFSTCIILVTILLNENVRNFIKGSFALEQDIEHQEGVMLFYNEYLINPLYFFGRGIKSIDISLESGYSFILFQIGFIGIFLFLLFLIFVFRDLSYKDIKLLKNKRVSTLAICLKGIIIGTFVITNFSFYPMTFNHYFFIWFLIGSVLGLVARRKKVQYEDERLGQNKLQGLRVTN